MSPLERSRAAALRVLQDYRKEIATKRQLGGYDDEALAWAERDLDQCEQALAEGDLPLVLVYHASAVKHLVWARGPIRDTQTIRDRQRMLSSRPRSDPKQQALELYRDQRPRGRKEFKRQLTEAGIPHTEDSANDWYTQARKRYAT